jgi:hypothetical protein
MQCLNQSLPSASLAIENGMGILFWTANCKAIHKEKSNKMQ